MRTKIQHKCTPAEGPDAQAIIHYGREPRRDLDFVPTTVAWPDPNPEDCSDEPLEKIVPLFPIKAYTPDKTYTIDISGGLNATGHFLWKMNESSFRANFHEPLLIHASKGKKDWAPNANVYRTGRAKHYRVIVNNPGGAGHPMHFRKLHIPTPLITFLTCVRWSQYVCSPPRPWCLGRQDDLRSPQSSSP